MLKIGDFSTLSRVTVQALRHYDELGLLKPERVDPLTGYRYYAYRQLSRLNRILALKDLGLSLEQIRLLLQRELPASELRGMLKLKRAEAEQRLADEQARLDRIEARLRQIEMENAMPDYDVVIKQLQPQPAASVRGTIPTYQHVGGLYEPIYAHLARHNAAPGVAAARWHDEGYREQDVDAEALVYLKSPVPESEQVKLVELPAMTVASLVHNGAYNRLGQAYDALTRWIDANGYHVTGPSLEVYHYVSQPVRQDDDAYVTELQFPVEKA